MKIAFKLLLWVLVTGVILFPALLLILFVIGLSVVVSGAMAISAVGLVLGIIFVALVGLSIMISTLIAGDSLYDFPNSECSFSTSW